MKIFNPIFLILILILPCNLFSETINLESAIQTGLKNNKEIQIAREKLNSAKADIMIARSAFFPNLEAKGTYTYIGIIPEAELEIPGFPSMPSTPLKMAKPHNWGASASLTQPLSIWGKIYNNYKRANKSYDIAKQQFRSTKADVEFKIKQSFYNVLLAQKMVKLSEESIKQAEEHLKVAQINYNAGVVSKYDLLSAEVNLVNLKPGLIKAENGCKISLSAFKNLIGLEPGEETQIEGEFIIEENEKIEELKDLIEHSLLHRPEVLLFNMQTELSDVLLSLTRAGNLPNLAFIINYNYTYIGEEKSAFESSTPHNWTFTLALTAPISEWFPWSRTSGETKKAKSGRKIIKLTKEQVIDGIKLEIESIYLDLEAAGKNITGQEQNVKRADEGLRIAQTRYRNGLMMNIELMGAEFALTQAKLNLLQAKYDYIIAKEKLKKAAGK